MTHLIESIFTNSSSLIFNKSLPLSPPHLLILPNIMSQSKSEEILLMYINDVLALERDIKEAVSRQIEDDDVRHSPEAAAFLQALLSSTGARLTGLGELSESLGGGAGMIKEAVTAAAGLLAGLYGKVRKHAVSRILRDDYTALALASTAYSMLYTTAVALRSKTTAALAQRHLREVTPLIMALSQIIPPVVVAELAADLPDLNHQAAESGQKMTAEAWSQEGETGSS